MSTVSARPQLIAVTGSTGFVGSNIARVLQEFGHNVVGLARRPVTGTPWMIREVDFESVDSLTEALAGADAVVHCAIQNDFNRLVDNHDEAYDSFVGMTARVTMAARSTGAHVVYVSTDWVMDGTGHRVPETEMGNPVNYYGFLKAMGEQVVRDLVPAGGAVCRIAGVMGQHQLGGDGPRSQDVGFGYFVHSLVDALSRGDRFTVWNGPDVNQVTSPSLAAEIGAQIERVIDRRATGTLHLVGDDAISRFDLALLVCDVFGLDHELLDQAPPPTESLFPAPVPVDSSLANEHTKQVLDLGPTSIRDLLAAFREELASGNPTPLSRPST